MGGLSGFERLMLPHLDAAFNLAFWLVRSEADAEDIVQEAYIRAFRGFRGFAGADARPWLLAIVRNAAYRWLSNRRRAANVISLDEAFGGPRADAAEPQIASEEPTPEALLIGEVDRNLVHSALAELPPVYREVVVLREIEGLAYREISRVTGAPIGTVMSRLARGRNELRKVLSRMMGVGQSNAV
ncbi:MAG TPA: sigma-70 family RNA polymerase sigma factor [Hyphomicrobiaceae bacterium]|jgi:RNA polymerase sigma-70 factor (ECF subfamily)|nr:sigma-70 family RNA polymerase sigma factor [Hyphomicrobiaceae bacterium]